MPVTLSMATAAMPMPYNPAKINETNRATTRMSVGTSVLSSPTAIPLMMFVAAPVSEAFAMRRTGPYSVLV